MMEYPEDAEGEAVYDVIRAIAKAANDEVAGYRRQTANYREYVETWVHEAKTPLVAAYLMLENLDDALANNAQPQEVHEKVDALAEEVDRVEGYIEQALFYARSESLDRDYVVRNVSLQSIVSSALKRNARAMISAHVAPVCRGLELGVFADEKWVEFILGQLIQNSVKYARDEGAQLLFAATRANAGGTDDCVKLVVRDNGCGVPAADLDRVFDRGFTGENGRNGKRSTGIGLIWSSAYATKWGWESWPAPSMGNSLKSRSRSQPIICTILSRRHGDGFGGGCLPLGARINKAPVLWPELYRMRLMTIGRSVELLHN